MTGHHSETQPRLPKGAPDGGEWRALEGEMGGFDLRAMGDDEYNANGSFEYPPAPRSAEQVLMFWANVPVSDTILELIEVTYNATRMQALTDLFNQKRTQYLGDRNLQRDLVRDGVTSAEQYAQSFVDEAVETHPGSVRRDDVRQVARAAQAYHQAERLSPDERAKVLSAEVFLNTQGGTTLTIEAVEQRFGLNDPELDFRAKGLFKDPTRWVGETVLSLRRDLTIMSDHLVDPAEVIRKMDDAEQAAAKRRR